MFCKNNSDKKAGTAHLKNPDTPAPYSTINIQNIGAFFGYDENIG